MQEKEFSVSVTLLPAETQLHTLWKVYSYDVLTDDALDFGHQATGWRRWGLFREVTRVEDIVHRSAVLAVVEQLIMLGIL